jgi:hypothetical protein
MTMHASGGDCVEDEAGGGVREEDHYYCSGCGC